MTRHKGLRKLAKLPTAPAVAALSLLLGWSTPVVGACDGPVPSFREAVTTADSIIVGTVVSITPMPDDPPGYARSFDLRVDHVLRGRSDPIITIRDLPQSPCSGVLLVPEGATIALALGATAFEPPMDVNAPAFITGVSYLSSVGGIGPPETITLEEVFALTGVPFPDTVAPDPSLPLVPFLIVAGLVIMSWLGFRSAKTGRSRP